MKQAGELRMNQRRDAVSSKTVNGFIALRPIPGCGAAASCRPPRSWRLSRRSGRVPALPYPPPRLPQSIVDHGRRAIDGSVACSGNGNPPAELRAQTRIGYQVPHPEEDCPRNWGF
jgi:hypothetical protein